METEWKIVCMEQSVCREATRILEGMGFRLLKRTPDSPDSDLVLSYEEEEDYNIDKKAQEVKKACRGLVQQMSIITIQSDKVWV